MGFSTIFITVGTTSFNSLLEAVNTVEIAEIIRKLNCSKLIIQYGRGEQMEMDTTLFAGIEVEVYGLKKSIIEDINRADLVIGHAGAGTCLEVLHSGKPLIVVVNESLMDNHQTELSRALTGQGVIASCMVAGLATTLSTFDEKKLKKVQPGNVKSFTRELNYLMGYV